MEVKVLYVVVLLLILVNYITMYQPWKKDNLNNDLRTKNFYFIIVTIGLLIRFYQVNRLPGLQIDEAMAGYDTWSLANYGIDSATNSWPVYLYSYGTGQSALYAYLSIPFVKILGLNIVSIRLAMLCISSLTLIFVVKTFSQLVLSKNWNILFVVILITNPWYFNLSRFGLDANLGPLFLLCAMCTILWAINTQKSNIRWLNYLCTVVFLGLTAYAYIVSWFLLPLFCLLLVIYLLKKHYLSIQQLLVGLGILTLILLPLIIFAGNQFLGNKNIDLFWLTIPKLSGTQLTGQSIFNGDSVLVNIVGNIKMIIYFIKVHLNDGLLFNGLPKFGVFYPGFLLFFIIGVVITFKRKEPVVIITKVWLLSCVPIILFSKPLVHHWNFLFFPFLIIVGYGMEYVSNKLSHKVYQVLLVYLTLMFILFQYNYFGVYRYNLQSSSYTASQKLGDIIEEIHDLDINFETIYVYSNSFSQKQNQFIYIRFFDPISPMDWQATKDQPYDKKNNLTSNYYGNYHFLYENEVYFDNKPKTGYLIQKYSENLIVPKEVEKSYLGIENDDYYFIYFP